MKVLVITNLFPTKETPMLGIFVTKRLEQYPKFGVNYKALSLAFQDSRGVRFVRKVLGRIENLPLTQLGSVKYEPILISRNIFEVILSKVYSYELLAKKFLSAIIKNFNVSEYDLIHAHGMYGVPAGEIAYLLAKKFKKPFVITLHGSDVNAIMPKRGERYKKILENASKCIFVSKALLEKARSFGYSGKNSVVIPNGFDPEIFKPMDKDKVRKELSIYKENTYYVGFVGNLIPVKRADKFPKIFRGIYEKLPNTRFIIVGDGPLRKKIFKKLKELDVIFTGKVPQVKVAKYMNAMDVMVLPSRNEGWPCVILEAQACGTAVVGSSNGGIPEAIGFEEFIVEEGDDFERRFSERVAEVLKRGYDRRKLIERAKEFTWENVVKKELEVLREVIG